MTAWPRVIYTDDAECESMRVEAEIDDAFVLHVTGESKDPSDDSIQLVGMTIRFPQVALESWIYLPEDAARLLRDALNEYLAMDGAT